VLWISDSRGKQVLRFDPQSTELTCVGRWPPQVGYQQAPSGLYVTQEEHVYLVDCGGFTIIKFCPGYEHGLCILRTREPEATHGFQDQPLDVCILGSSLYVLHRSHAMCYELPPRINLGAATDAAS